MKHRTRILIAAALILLGPWAVQAQGPDRADKPDARIVLHAAGRGNPWVNLLDGLPLAADYDGPTALTQLLKTGQAQALSLAAADFDRDGMPDLATGYAAPGGGLVTTRRGNVDLLWPEAAEAQQRKAAGTFTDAPFLSPARISALSIAPDFLAAGDFDADGYYDLVAAAHGGKLLYWLPGDGIGGFGPAQTVQLPGRVTALTVGEINRRDGLADLVVGVDGDAGPQVLAFEGPGGALRSAPEVFEVPAKVTALALAELDGHFAMDLAVAAGRELLIIHGRDRQLSLPPDWPGAKVSPAMIDRHELLFDPVAMAVGDLTPEDEHRLEVALLSDDGIVHVLDPATAREIMGYSLALANSPAYRLGLVATNVSGLPGDDLVVIDLIAQQLHVVVMGATETPDQLGTAVSFSPRSATLDVAGSPVAVLPMRLNVDALSDLVVAADGTAGLTVGLTAPLATFTVNSTGGEKKDCDLGDGVCIGKRRTEMGGCVVVNPDCTLAAALSEASRHPGSQILFNVAPNNPDGSVTIPSLDNVRVRSGTTILGASQPGYADHPIVEVQAGLVADNDRSAQSDHVGYAFGRFGYMDVRQQWFSGGQSIGD
ncbi:MAG: hypothetical protein AUK03_16585 [Anaerolineae bacterium CG2_30_64_16]|nr:MAG: hypothetical protein AUK03_16585 [Anaerolineae bacterium CG2_30_64_16]